MMRNKFNSDDLTNRQRLLRMIALLLVAAAVVCVASVLSSCRRDLYVFGDEFHSMQLEVDWRQYQSSDPDGMTCWFFPDDETVKPYRFTTSSVRHLDFYLPKGHYTGVVIDYSPEEYSRQEFVDMERLTTAAVCATRASYQPEDSTGLELLYGTPCFYEPLGTPDPQTGLYMVSNQPEQMALDTISPVRAYSGEYGDYIPYEERDDYQSTLTVQTYYATPTSPIWHMRIRIYIKGYDYLYQTEGSLAGLADGRFLALGYTTDRPCLISMPDWETQRTGDNVGYIATTISTFGLRSSQRPHVVYITDEEGNFVLPAPAAGAPAAAPAATRADDESRLTLPEDLRLNLRLLLRDRQTYVDYHFDVGDHVVSYEDELVLRLDLGEDFPDGPDLPYVEAYNGTGFGADVTPWEDSGGADVTM